MSVEQPKALLVSLNANPFAPLSDPFAGGQAKNVRSITTELINAGWQIVIVTLGQSRDSTKEIHGNNCAVYKIGGKNSKGFDYDYDKEDIERIYQINKNTFSSIRPDIVMSFYWASGVFVQSFLKSNSSKWIASMCSYGIERGIYENGSQNYARIECEKEILSSANLVIATTQHEISMIKYQYMVDTQEIFFLPRWIDSQAFYPILQVLFIGRAVPRKGLDTLFDATNLQSFCKWRVSIVGPTQSEFDQLINTEYYNRDRFVVLGPVDHKIIPQIINQSDVVVVPSYYETFGNVALEALACGRPVVASRVGGLPELVIDHVTGLLFEPGNANELADCLNLLAHDSSFRDKLSKQALSISSKFEKIKIQKKLTDKMNDLLL